LQEDKAKIMAGKNKIHSKVLIQGPIKPEFIGASIAKHSGKTGIGAHAIFLGQVRKDSNASGATVNEIVYSAHEAMAEKVFSEIREEAFAKFDMVCMHIYHSLGAVKTGEISLFVFVSCKHRKASFRALEEIVEKIKLRVPIWKKEIFENGQSRWI
jgi:molybdopterin synthase catalytic subunit